MNKRKTPGSHIINSINCHTPEISRFVDNDAQTIVEPIQLYFKDNDNFINKINDFPVPEISLLVTLDVKLLYMSIRSNNKIDVIKRKFDNYLQKTKHTKVLATFLAIIFALSSFIFNSKFYSQIK